MGYNISERNQRPWAQASDLPDPELSDEGRPTVPWVPWVAKISGRWKWGPQQWLSNIPSGNLT